MMLALDQAWPPWKRTESSDPSRADDKKVELVRDIIDLFNVQHARSCLGVLEP